MVRVMNRLEHLRALRSAASLKVGAADVENFQVSSPRSSERGLVEGWGKLIRRDDVRLSPRSSERGLVEGMNRASSPSKAKRSPRSSERGLVEGHGLPSRPDCGALSPR